MLRYLFRGINEQLYKFRYIRRKNSSSKDRKCDEDIAYESEYYYKQDKELLKILKQKTQDEIKTMQEEIETMRTRIEEYNRDINENLRFLKGLEKDTPTNKDR